jgi:hypothetical protein
MTKRVIPQRTRFFLAVEGEGEQAFIKWLQELSDQQEMHVHLESEVLGGGGYKSMLANGVRYRERKERKKQKPRSCYWMQIALLVMMDGQLIN